MKSWLRIITPQLSASSQERNIFVIATWHSYLFDSATMHALRVFLCLGPNKNPEVFKTVEPENQEVSCFVKLKSQFFVVNKTKREIQVNDESTNFVDSISIPEVNLPAAFTGSEATGCLYLSDRTSNGCVWLIKPPVTAEAVFTVRPWKKFDNANENAQAMSATHDGRILILVAIGLWDMKTWHGRLDVHQVEGECVRDLAVTLHVS